MTERLARGADDPFITTLLSLAFQRRGLTDVSILT
jgi:hypothetical protein